MSTGNATMTISDQQFFLTDVQIAVPSNGNQLFFIPNQQPFPLGITMTVSPVVSADRRFVPNPAAEFTGNIDGGQNRLDRSEIRGRPVPSAIQIDQMQASCPLADPAAGHFGRVIAIDRLAPVIALPQAHALAAGRGWPAGRTSRNSLCRGGCCGETEQGKLSP